MRRVVLTFFSLNGSSSDVGKDAVTEKDLEHLLHLLEGLGESVWQHMMDRLTPNMAYQAWRYEPEVYVPHACRLMVLPRIRFSLFASLVVIAMS